MTWFKVDDSFYDHPKAFDASDGAVALWTRAGTWCARNLTGGFVPATRLAGLCSDPTSAAGELVRRGLWSRARGGYQFHDWEKYQPTKEQVEAERKANAERQRRYREKRNGRSNGVIDAVTHPVSNGTPTRPDPPPLGGEGRRRASPAARADPADAPPSPAESGPPCRSCGNRITSAYHRRHCREEPAA